MGCTPGASLSLPTPLTDNGDYVFNVLIDGTTLTCAATLPFEGTNPTCDPGLGSLLQARAVDIDRKRDEPGTGGPYHRDLARRAGR